MQGGGAIKLTILERTYFLNGPFEKQVTRLVSPLHRINMVHMITSIIISAILRFSNKNCFLCVVSNLTNILNQFEKGISPTQTSENTLVQINYVFGNYQIQKTDYAVSLLNSPFFKDISLQNKACRITRVF